MKLSRRQWLSSGFVAGAGLSAKGWTSLVRGDSPASRIRVGVIGTGVRGKSLIGDLPASAQVQAICDCATSRMAETLQPTGKFKTVLASFQSERAADCSTHQDYRRMLDVAQLDAVIIATPDHHHVQAAMLALQAGLDVYLEKPLSVTIREGRLLADAVQATGRVLQVGSQQRSMEMNRFACEFIRDGGLGKVSHVDFPNFPGPMTAPSFDAQPIPNGLDWELFLGPTAQRPHHRKLWVKDEFKVGDLMWRGWDLFRDYSGHLMTNWGAHNIDMVQYALGMDRSGPVRIEPIRNISEPALASDWKTKWFRKTPYPSGRFADDRRFMPVKVTYANGVTLRLLPGIKETTFYGERGSMRISRNRFKCDPQGLVKNEPDPSAATLWEGEGIVARPHLQNWIDCIASRQKPHASVEIGHRTVTVCHLVNIARELDRALQWDPDQEQFVDDREADSLLDRPRRERFELPRIT
ncbi:Gfo/Idh/MocA family oxidoreductase [Stieleria sp. TO1_6]|uniref:Gfo/Idh/MocA family protein n=1 Tax=Stieleria tagensis TaxID=2956795 RepID=UPI00209B6745|nr:Gfo/Idh/MocA family oxidoreductase [Stieleria tagensis]MCO8124181.1 Gfo/Idh/MocA family oxidoreductase [Stieleria tagensis]